MRAPVAPSGWPSEMPPPFGLTSSQRSSSPASCDELEHDRGERLVHLDHGDVVPGRGPPSRAPCRRPAGLPCSIRCGSTPERPKETKRARGSSPRRRGRLLARDEHAGRAVADLARVARGDHAVRQERRLQRGELLGRRVAPRRLVDREERRRRLRFADLDRDDLVLEAALVDRRERAPVRLERVRVELLARELPLLGDHLGGDPLRHDLPALEQLVGEVAAVRAHRHAGHHLDAGRDDDVELARPDRGGRVEVRLHRRAALAVDGRAADRLRPAGDQRDHPADVPALLADLRHAAHLHVLDLRRVEVVPRDAGRSAPARRARRRGCRASVPFRLPIGERTASMMSASVGIDWPFNLPPGTAARNRERPSARARRGPRTRCRSRRRDP